MLPRNWAASLIALLLTLAAVLGFALHRQIGATAVAREEARTAQEGLEKLQATSARRERQRAATARQEAAARHRLDAALAKSPEWADQPVPQEIQDALADPADSDPERVRDEGPDADSAAPAGTMPAS